MLKTRNLLDLSRSIAGEWLARFEYPWQALPHIREEILALGETLGAEYRQPLPQVWVHRSASVAPTASLAGPCIIGPGTEIRHCAFIRGCALVGEGCVVGNSAELKNVILFDGVQVPHFNYAGDSILGYRAHMGAGAVTSNVKADKSAVCVKCGSETHCTGLKKFGAILGDYAEIGCNTVLNPGTVVGRNSSVYPACCVRGTVPENSIYKTGGIITARR